MRLIQTYPSLAPMIEAVKPACVNWRDLRDNLRQDQSPDITWFSVIKNGSNKYFQPNNSTAELRPIDDCNSLPGSEWLVLTFFDSGWQECTTLNPIIADKFSNFIADIKQLPGLVCAMIHFIGHGIDIPLHTDGNNNDCYTALATIANPPSDVFLTVESENFIAYNQPVFAFDSTKLHSVTNNSGGDWVFVVLRIQQEYFQ